MSDEVFFEYVGEFIDPDQSPLTAALYACSLCGALVSGHTDDRHREWHAGGAA